MCPDPAAAVAALAVPALVARFGSAGTLSPASIVSAGGLVVVGSIPLLPVEGIAYTVAMSMSSIFGANPQSLVELSIDRRDLNWARDVVDRMRERTGLLLEQTDGVFSFPHRTFQEYMAGAHLATHGEFARTAAAKAADGELWREVILLAVGKLVHVTGELDKPILFVAELLARAGDDDDGWRLVLLASEVLVEIGPVRARDTALGAAQVSRAIEKLEDLVRLGRLTDGEREAASRALAELRS